VGSSAKIDLMLVIFTTTPDIWEAESLAEKIVSEKLAACVQILPQMTSYYFWEGEVQKEGEHLLLIKTVRDNYDALEKFILENHSYEVPEIVAVDAERISASYYAWMKEYLGK
jgi:periplasmic divalent cation tolerance protein